MRTLSPIMNWAPRSLVTDLFGDFDQFFDGFDRSPMSFENRSYMPAAEVSENEDHYLVSFDVPGMKKEDLKIEMNGNLLTVSGERKREVSSGKSDKVQHVERSYGSFQRSFTLPQTVDGEKIEASYQDGVLQISIPKTQAAKPRRIEIKTEKGGFMSKLLGNKSEEKTQAS